MWRCRAAGAPQQCILQDLAAAPQHSAVPRYAPSFIPRACRGGQLSAFRMPAPPHSATPHERRDGQLALRRRYSRPAHADCRIAPADIVFTRSPDGGLEPLGTGAYGQVRASGWQRGAMFSLLAVHRAAAVGAQRGPTGV